MTTNSYSPNGFDPVYAHILRISPEISSTGNTIEISETKGAGFVKSFFVDKGFCIGLYHMRFNEDLHFKWVSDEDAMHEQMFKLIFRFNSDVPGFEKEQFLKCATENSTVMYSTDFERRGFIPKNKWYNAIGMIITASWLQENFAEASDEIYNIVKLLAQKNEPTFIAELMEHHHYDIAKELAVEMMYDKPTPIRIKTKSLLLVNDFLNKIVQRKTADIIYNQTLYQPKMVKVEQLLSNFFDKPFPNLNMLAKEFHMSTPTLKRHFKIVYGKNIHQYYLEKKLAIGKEMILQKKKTVSETAYTLGYNKINSFSKVFKKYYGFLPKEAMVQ